MGTRRHRLTHAARQHHATQAMRQAYLDDLAQLALDLQSDDEDVKTTAMKRLTTLAATVGLTPPVEAAE